MEEIRVNTNEISWQESVDLPGAEVKRLGGMALPTVKLLYCNGLRFSIAA